MKVSIDLASIDQEQVGAKLYALIRRLYPICRSITGNGVRETLSIIKEHIPLEIHEVPTGTPVFDWVIPKEWNIRDAWIKNGKGERVVDFKKSNLHVVSYSVPVHTTLKLAELKKHLHSLPDYPDWIPYRTSYYNDAWGFCLSHKHALELKDGEYEVHIDSTLKDGSLTYGEYYLSGKIENEILLYTHVCHPSLCNDNLSGIALVAMLAKYLSEKSPRYSYRFIFGPGTIGSITWLSQNEANLGKIKHGLVVGLVGDAGHLTYKKSQRGDTEIDRSVAQVLKHGMDRSKIVDFSPYGYDERQFCSPGINLPVGRLTRTPNGCYPEYHTSADNLDFVKPASLAESFVVTFSILNVLENNLRYLNTSPKGEPQLGKRGLYRKTGGSDIADRELALLWVLNQSDGERSLLDIAERSGLRFGAVSRAAADLKKSGLLDLA